MPHRESPPAANQGAITTGQVDTTILGQLPPVGPHPSAGVLLVGSLLWTAPQPAAEVLALVCDEDMGTPALSTVLAAVRSLVDSGTPAAPQLVLDALKREGNVKCFAAKDLQDAVTCGAQPQAARQYAAAVLADALRRRLANAGVALATAATESAEVDLAPMVARASESIRDCAERLATLRGDSS